VRLLRENGGNLINQRGDVSLNGLPQHLLIDVEVLVDLGGTNRFAKDLVHAL
jgi:hypothetical protein